MHIHSKPTLVLSLALILTLVAVGVVAAQENEGEDDAAFEHPVAAVLGEYFGLEAGQVAAYREQGIGFGVMVKLSAIAAESQEACGGEESTGDESCGVTVAELVTDLVRHGPGRDVRGTRPAVYPRRGARQR
jgi:hypothetical protein